MGAVLYRNSKAMKKPVVFILGSTGTGKTDLSIALARRCNGEIINADAMQMYKGLDIVTNKATPDERATCPHHLLDTLEPENMSYTVHDFRKEAQQIISDLQIAEKLPIIVGGTNYYMDSLIWESLITDPHLPGRKSSPVRHQTCTAQPNDVTRALLACTASEYSEAVVKLEHDLKKWTEQQLESLDTEFLQRNIKHANKELLHTLLQSVDPIQAMNIHPNQARKTIRGIEIYKKNGQSATSFLKQLNSEAGELAFGAKMCYENILVLWLLCDQEILDTRLDRRVDNMLERGLLEELSTFHQQYNKQRLCSENVADYTRGIFQSIGFKEFHQYLLLDASDRESDYGHKVLQQGIVDLKSATRRYARYQNRWVRKQFFQERNVRSVPPIYALDSTDKKAFQRTVIEPAVKLVDDIIHERRPELSVHTMPDVARESSNPAVHRTCPVCGTLCIRLTEWQSHIQSRKHKKKEGAEKRRQKLQKEQSRMRQTSGEPQDGVNYHGNALEEQANKLEAEPVRELCATLDNYHKQLTSSPEEDNTPS